MTEIKQLLWESSVTHITCKNQREIIFLNVKEALERVIEDPGMYLVELKVLYQKEYGEGSIISEYKPSPDSVDHVTEFFAKKPIKLEE